MSSAKPYLIRAIYEWIVDNGYTPYISVDTTLPLVTVPEQYIQNNMIVLDISSEAANELLVDNTATTFKASFGGVPHDIYVPIAAITSIYAAENNQGMSFPEEEYPADDIDDSIATTPSSPKTGKPTVKNHHRW